jgi:hypothetical protein
MTAQAKPNLSDKPLKLRTKPAANRGDKPKPAASTRPAAAEPGKGNSGPKQPCGWADIVPGAIVLARDPPKYADF